MTLTDQNGNEFTVLELTPISEPNWVEKKLNLQTEEEEAGFKKGIILGSCAVAGLVLLGRLFSK